MGARWTTLAVAALAACRPSSPGPTAVCEVADHCVTIGEDGAIDSPALQIHAGESVAFLLGNRWQSVVDIERRDPTACDDETLELPYVPGEGLTGPMPRFAGGIVVRGTPEGAFRFPDEVWQSDAISGVLLVIPWRDVEPAPGVYDFDVYVDALRQATKHGKLVSVGVQMGSKSPDWIYDFDPALQVPGTDMVTRATSGDRCFDQVHPSFWDERYVQRITALQTALASELTARAGGYRHVDKIKLTGVNFMTSETRLPVDRAAFCGFADAVCSNGDAPPTPCVNSVCPLGGSCGCHVDPADGVEKCGRTTDDLPQLWADAGYRPSRALTYFSDLFAEQHALFPDKDINLMEIARAFPNVSEAGAVQGFADPDDVRALIEHGYQALPDHFVVLNAALRGTEPPQDICLESYDLGVGQIGFQNAAGLDTWTQAEAALVNARDVETPGGVQAVSFVEIYLSTFEDTVASGQTDSLRSFDETFRERSGLPGREGEVHLVEDLAPGAHHYKIGGTSMTGGACHTGSITVASGP